MMDKLIIIFTASENTFCAFRGAVDPPKSFQDYCWTLPTTHAYLMVLSDLLWHPNDLFKQHPKVQNIFFFHALGVNPEYRKRGIAKELVKRGLQLAQDNDCQCIVVMATSPFSRKIFNDLGFEMLRIVDWRNFVMDYKNGRYPIFPEVDSSVHIKLL